MPRGGSGSAGHSPAHEIDGKACEEEVCANDPGDRLGIGPSDEANIVTINFLRESQLHQCGMGGCFKLPTSGARPNSRQRQEYYADNRLLSRNDHVQKLLIANHKYVKPKNSV